MVRVCTALSREALPWCVCVLHCLERHYIKLPDDGFLVIRNMVKQFKYFKYFIIILILSTNFIFVHLLVKEVF